jgi:hypothetical protein
MEEASLARSSRHAPRLQSTLDTADALSQILRSLRLSTNTASGHLGEIFHRSQGTRDSTPGTADSLVASSPQPQSRSLPWRDIDCTRCHREPLAPIESSVSSMTTMST